MTHDDHTPSKKEAGNKWDGGKLPWDLLPVGPIRQVVQVLEFGSGKYDPWNWAKGMSWSRLYASTKRHLEAWWWDKEDMDPETGIHHLAHAVCGLTFLLHYAETTGGTDDRPGIAAGSNGDNQGHS
jgi:hypothetical protein